MLIRTANKQSTKLFRLREEVDVLELQRQKQYLESITVDDETRYVDPLEPYFDAIQNERWMPIGALGDEKQIFPYRNEQELTLLRQKAKVRLWTNPYFSNLINSIKVFQVGKGHVYNTVVKKKYRTHSDAKELALDLQDFVDELLKMNRWKVRQKETIVRYHRDGEVLQRSFFQKDGFTKFRFAEPFDLKTPGEELGNSNSTFGILTEDDDVEDPIEYYFGDDTVDATFVQHRKANVDLNSKRGLTSAYVIGPSLDRATKILRNMSTTVENQTAISMIRKHKAPKGAVQDFQISNATWSRENTQSGVNEKFKKLKPGTVLDTKNVEYVFPALGINASAPVAILAAELRAIASSKSLPEYMVGSDASNSNFASTLVAESPAVRFFESEADEQIDYDLELIWQAIEHAVDTGRLDRRVLVMIDVVVEPPNPVSRDKEKEAKTDAILIDRKVKSVQTARTEWGLDSDQEDANNSEFLDGDGIDSAPLDRDGDDGVVTGEMDTDSLTNKVGGITGMATIMEQLNGKVITLDSALAQIQLFYKVTHDEAVDLIGGSDELEAVETGGGLE